MPDPTPPNPQPVVRTQPNTATINVYPIYGPWSSWTPVDNSQYFLDLDKLKAMPRSMQEAEGYLERLDEHGWEVTRTYKCAWSDAAAAMQWLYGYSSVVEVRQLQGTQPKNEPDAPPPPPPPPPYKLSRVIPAQDPYRPYLFCAHAELTNGQGAWIQDPAKLLTDAKGEPIDPDGKVLGADDPKQAIVPAKIFVQQGSVQFFQDGYATIRAMFRPRPYPVQTDAVAWDSPLGERCRYVEVRRRYAVQSLPLRSQADLWKLQFPLDIDGDPLPDGVAGKRIPEPGIVILPAQSFDVVWHDVPFDPALGIYKCMGKVNAGPFALAPGFPANAPTYDIGTLLCEAPDGYEPVTRNAGGSPSWTVRLRFSWKPHSWNDYPASDGKYYPATFGGDINDPSVYAYEWFENLFLPQAPPPW